MIFIGFATHLLEQDVDNRRHTPPVSAALLRLAIGYQLQARALGGPSTVTEKALKGSPVPAKRTLVVRPGSRLVRDWRSLSEVARAVTGTRWSGPAFFGLREKAAA